MMRDERRVANLEISSDVMKEFKKLGLKFSSFSSIVKELELGDVKYVGIGAGEGEILVSCEDLAYYLKFFYSDGNLYLRVSSHISYTDTTYKVTFEEEQVILERKPLLTNVRGSVYAELYSFDKRFRVELKNGFELYIYFYLFEYFEDYESLADSFLEFDADSVNYSFFDGIFNKFEHVVYFVDIIDSINNVIVQLAVCDHELCGISYIDRFEVRDDEEIDVCSGGKYELSNLEFTYTHRDVGEVKDGAFSSFAQLTFEQEEQLRMDAENALKCIKEICNLD